MARLIPETVICCIVGAFCAFLTDEVCVYSESKMLLLFRTLSGISLISGSFLGFSISWISHCRGIVRDIEYGAAEDLFFKLEKKQKELIYRWLVALLLAVIIGVSTVLISLTPGWKYILFILLAIAYGQILVLFLGMLSLGHLRTKLDDHERKELRKKRHTPPDIDSQEYKSLSKASP